MTTDVERKPSRGCREMYQTGAGVRGANPALAYRGTCAALDRSAKVTAAAGHRHDDGPAGRVDDDAMEVGRSVVGDR